MNIAINTENIKKISYKQEIYRKMIHITSLSIPYAFYYMDNHLFLYILISISAVFVISDILSKRNSTINFLVEKFFGKILRKHEHLDKFQLNGASWVLISASLIFLIFPENIALISFTILIISDTAAALIGRKFGKHKVLKKSWEGTITFFITAFAVIIFYINLFSLLSSIYIIIALITAFIGAYIELISKDIGVDDNISIPFSVGITLWLISSLSHITL